VHCASKLVLGWAFNSLTFAVSVARVTAAPCKYKQLVYFNNKLNSNYQNVIHSVLSVKVMAFHYLCSSSIHCNVLGDKIKQQSLVIKLLSSMTSQRVWDSFGKLFLVFPDKFFILSMLSLFFFF
jgi:hypothetical protein